MDARELRIGNLIQLKVDGEILFAEVDVILKNSIDVTILDLKGIDMLSWEQTVDLDEDYSIPITEERLEQFTFNHSRLKKFKGSWYLFQNFTLKPNGKGYSVYLINAKIADVEFVHTFQNLIFALTGTELEISQ